MPSALFASTSPYKPSLLTISFAENPTESLGAQLNNRDNGETAEMFIPSYLTILMLLDGDTVARKSGVLQGDCIVCVNGEGFRRFPPDWPEGDLEHLSGDHEEWTDEQKVKRAETLTGLDIGEHYNVVLDRIKEIKAEGDANPLILTLERHGWDAKANSFGRFLVARDSNIVQAMGMLEKHEQWRERMFPIDLTSPSLQEILKLKAISEICVNPQAPTVYVNYAKLAVLEHSHTPEDVVKVFIMFTEIMLGKAPDPTHPKTCQFIDLTGVVISVTGFRVDILKALYAAFEPNYPEALHTMVLYPVSKTMSSIIKAMLRFVNSKTLDKIVMTDDLEVVYKELGWDKEEVDASGGFDDFVRKNDKAANDLIIEI